MSANFCKLYSARALRNVCRALPSHDGAADNIDFTHNSEITGATRRVGRYQSSLSVLGGTELSVSQPNDAICLREYQGKLLPPGALSLSLLILFILQCLSTPCDNISNRVGTTIARCAKYAARRGNKYVSRKIRNPVSLTHRKCSSIPVTTLSQRRIRARDCCRVGGMSLSQ